jgi:hypothetical protein
MAATDFRAVSKSWKNISIPPVTFLRASTLLPPNLYPVPSSANLPKSLVASYQIARWGLIPSWASDVSGATKVINARSETAATKPAFRDARKLAISEVLFLGMGIIL